MATASRTVTIHVQTQRGSHADAEQVLNDVLAGLRKTDLAYLSVGEVNVLVSRPMRGQS